MSAALIHFFQDLDKSVLGNKPTTYPWTAIITLAVLGWVVSWYRKPTSEFPTVNDDSKAWTSFGTRKEYVQNARKLLAEGHRKVILSKPTTSAVC